MSTKFYALGLSGKDMYERYDFFIINSSNKAERLSKHMIFCYFIDLRILSGIWSDEMITAFIFLYLRQLLLWYFLFWFDFSVGFIIGAILLTHSYVITLAKSALRILLIELVFIYFN